MQFDLVSPERLLASVEAAQVRIPGAEGDMTAMPGHAPLIAALRPGVLKVSGPDGDSEFVVSGGFAEIGLEGVSVLAELAIPRDEITAEQYGAMVDAAAQRLSGLRESGETEPGEIDDAEKFVADTAALGAEIGLSAG